MKRTLEEKVDYLNQNLDYTLRLEYKAGEYTLYRNDELLSGLTKVDLFTIEDALDGAIKSTYRQQIRRGDNIRYKETSPYLIITLIGLGILSLVSILATI